MNLVSVSCLSFIDSKRGLLLSVEPRYRSLIALSIRRIILLKTTSNSEIDPCAISLKVKAPYEEHERIPVEIAYVNLYRSFFPSFLSRDDKATAFFLYFYFIPFLYAIF